MAYLGEIKMMASAAVPPGWLPCDGSVQQISTYSNLFTLIGTAYGPASGGYFTLPNLGSRTPVAFFAAGQGTGPIGASGGAEQVALISAPPHSHDLMALNTAGVSANGYAGMLAISEPTNPQPTVPRPIYGNASGNVYMTSGQLSVVGASVAHTNMQPFAVLNFCISYSGEFPPRP